MCRELREHTGEPWSLSAAHTTLRRLDRKGYVQLVPIPGTEYRYRQPAKHAVPTALGRRALRRTLDVFGKLRRLDSGRDLLTGQLPVATVTAVVLM